MDQDQEKVLQESVGRIRAGNMSFAAALFWLFYELSIESSAEDVLPGFDHFFFLFAGVSFFVGVYHYVAAVVTLRRSGVTDAYHTVVDSLRLIDFWPFALVPPAMIAAYFFFQ